MSIDARRQRGLSLIELIIFIVIIGVGLAGITVTYNTVVVHSADPMVRKQALAIAQSLLQEIEQQAFTYCDPQDANVLTALNGAACTNDQNKGGAAFPAPGSPAPTPAGETRGHASNPYDNVTDYAGYQATGDVITGVATLADYTASVTISRVGGGGAFAALPADAALQIVVRVTGRNEEVSLTGYRVRYAPNAPG